MKKAAAPGPPATKAERETKIQALFATLDRHLDAGSYESAVKTADAILAESPGEPAAFRCKLSALLLNGQLPAAESAVLALPPAAAAEFGVEIAYCRYRRGALPQALESLASVPAARSAAALSLRAQVLYKAGDGAGACAAYESLFATDKAAGRNPELQANVTAAYIAAGRSAEVPKLLDALKATPDSLFELAFNAGTALAASGDLAEAEAQLHRARRAGAESFLESCDDDAPPDADAMAAELAPADVQLAAVAALRGRKAEAAESLAAIVTKRAGDAATLAIAATNLAAARGASDALDGLKRLDKLLDKGKGDGDKAGGKAGGGDAPAPKLIPALTARLPPETQAAILGTRAQLLYWAGRHAGCSAAASALASAAPADPGPPSLAAAALMRLRQSGQAIALLTSAAAAPAAAASAGRLLLACAQVAAMDRDWTRTRAALDAACDAPTQADLGLRHRPAMVATQIALCEALGDGPRAAQTLAAAIDHWEGRAARGDTAAGAPLRALLGAAAAAAAAAGDARVSAGHYNRLLEVLRSPGGGGLDAASRDAAISAATVGLLSAAAVVDADAAERAAATLPPIPGVDDLDGETLEAAGVPPAPWGGRKYGAGKDKGDSDASAKVRPPKKRKARPSRLPKGFDPANPGPPPDPERWLPKCERAAAKRSKKKGGGATGGPTGLRGPQGASAADAKAAESKAKAAAEAAEAKAAAAEAAAKAAAEAKPKKKGRK